MKKHLFVGGLVAVGFDPEEKYLLTVSHAGRGVFSLDSWERVARDSETSYPEEGYSTGIGPISGISIPVIEFDDDAWQLNFQNPSKTYNFDYEDGTITVTGNMVGSCH